MVTKNHTVNKYQIVSMMKCRVRSEKRRKKRRNKRKQRQPRFTNNSLHPSTEEAPMKPKPSWEEAWRLLVPQGRGLGQEEHQGLEHQARAAYLPTVLGGACPVACPRMAPGGGCPVLPSRGLELSPWPGELTFLLVNPLKFKIRKKIVEINKF